MTTEKHDSNAIDRLMILGGVRTVFARAGRELSEVPAEELARQATRELVCRLGFERSFVDEVIFGCVGQNARAANIARVIALLSGFPQSVPAMTVHRNCASGMEAVTQAALRMVAGRGRLFVVGGTESMSGYPLEFNREATRWFSDLSRARSGMAKARIALRFRPRFLKPEIALLRGLKDPVYDVNMGQTAENVARDFEIDREAQDAFALESHRKAEAAREKLREEIMPTVGDDDRIWRDDRTVREGQTMEALARLRPVFDRRFGTVTAGNACPVTDGAVALLAGTEEAAAELEIEPLGRLVDYTYVGLDPTRMGLGPVHAMARLFDRTGLGVDDIDLFEINEAFAAQVLGVLAAMRSTDYARSALGRRRALGEIPMEKLNVNGGAIALGHPVGASGARLVLTLLLEMRRRGAKRGIATLCVGGGQGAALLFERI